MLEDTFFVAWLSCSYNKAAETKNFHLNLFVDLILTPSFPENLRLWITNQVFLWTIVQVLQNLNMVLILFLPLLEFEALLRL